MVLFVFQKELAGNKDIALQLSLLIKGYERKKNYSTLENKRKLYEVVYLKLLRGSFLTKKVSTTL